MGGFTMRLITQVSLLTHQLTTHQPALTCITERLLGDWQADAEDTLRYMRP